MNPGFRAHVVKAAKKNLFVILAFSILFLSGCSNEQKQLPGADNGILDLSSWNFALDGKVPLDGGWEFYWQQLLTPDDFPLTDLSPAKLILPLSTLWADLKENHPEFSESGFGTYRLTLANLNPRDQLILRVNSLMGAYKIWINGSLVSENGSIGRKKALQRTGRPGVVLISVPSKTDAAHRNIELVVQVSRYDYISGGTEFSFILGPESQMITEWDRERFFLIFSVTMLFVMGAYHLVFFFYKRRDSSLLYFSIYCFSWMTALFITGTYHWLVTFIFPDAGLTTIMIIDHVAYFYSIPFLFLFAKAMFPDETPSFIPYMYLALATLLSIWFIFNYEMGRTIITLGHIVAVTAMIFCSSTIFKAVVARRQSSLFILLGGVFLMLCGFNDILNDLSIIRTGHLMSIGLLVFIGSQSCSLAIRFATSFNVAEDLGVQLKEKNLALSRLDRLKDEFIANTTHELCTPLSGIIGIAESMMAGAAGKMSSEALQNLDMMAASGRRLNGLVENILDFSRLKSRDLNLNSRPVNISGLVAITLKLLTPLAQPKGLILINEIPENLPPVMADENRLHQIFYNLIGNAIKFTQKGQVTVSAEKAGASMKISVRDTGIGIPEDKQDKIFLHFEQVRSHGIEHIEGTGLGLPITKQLVELHHGTIGLDSRPDCGTIFYFTLPLADKKLLLTAPAGEMGIKLSALSKITVLPTAPAALPETGKKGSEPSGDCTTILVVDDDPINLQVAVNQLKTQEFDVHTALSGEEALASISKGRKPDLVLLDIMMPGMNGYEVCQILRETHSMSELPVIMLTARTRLQDMVKGFESGANDYLTKPFARDELLARVKIQVKLNRAYKILQENSRLKKEIQRRKRTELDLRMMQQRLSGILDSLDDAILAVNENFEICFSSAPCRELLGYSTRELLGRPVDQLLCKPTGQAGKEFLDHLARTADPGPIELLHKDGTQLSCGITMAELEMENEGLHALIIQYPPPFSSGSSAHSPHHQSLEVIDAINRNRQRIEMLEDAAADRISPAAGPWSAPQGPSGNGQAPPALADYSLERHRLGAEVMNLALDLWQDETSMTKVDLAEQSGIWKVYMNQNGFERTQTLDKYLDPEKFPSRPRWPRIYRTAEFVLISSRASPQKNALETAVSSLKQLR